jgi:hypothetical protein
VGQNRPPAGGRGPKRRLVVGFAAVEGAERVGRATRRYAIERLDAAGVSLGASDLVDGHYISAVSGQGRDHLAGSA